MHARRERQRSRESIEQLKCLRFGRSIFARRKFENHFACVSANAERLEHRAPWILLPEERKQASSLRDEHRLTLFDQFLRRIKQRFLLRRGLERAPTQWRLHDENMLVCLWFRRTLPARWHPLNNA